jgi:type I restriction enzyme S subunit
MLERAKTSAGQFNINIEGLSAIPVELPTIKVQRRFADQVHLVETTISLQCQHAAKLDELFISLQHRAFHGSDNVAVRFPAN